MRSLIKFFIRYNSFFVFLLLQAVCVFLIVRNRSYHRTTFLNSSSRAFGSVYKSYDGLVDYLHLQAVNDSLLEENARLLSLMPGAFTDDQVWLDTACSDELRQEYSYIAAEVIKKTTNQANNYITLNRGRKHGVREDMGVILPNGVVGVINQVSEHMSTAMTALNTLSPINVKLKKSGHPGYTKWDGGRPDLIRIKDMPHYVPVEVGDTMVTRRGSSIFPEGVMVGTVTDFSIGQGENYYDITLKLSTNFETLHYVYIVNYLYQEEQRELEKASLGE